MPSAAEQRSAVVDRPWIPYRIRTVHPQVLSVAWSSYTSVPVCLGAHCLHVSKERRSLNLVVVWPEQSSKTRGKPRFQRLRMISGTRNCAWIVPMRRTFDPCASKNKTGGQSMQNGSIMRTERRRSPDVWEC